MVQCNNDDRNIRARWKCTWRRCAHGISTSWDPAICVSFSMYGSAERARYLHGKLQWILYTNETVAPEEERRKYEREKKNILTYLIQKDHAQDLTDPIARVYLRPSYYQDIAVCPCILRRIHILSFPIDLSFRSYRPIITFQSQRYAVRRRVPC